MAKAMGVESPVEPTRPWCSAPPGMTVMDQATAYAVFANGGYAGTATASPRC
jgi:penicillin-binding protein 1A